MRPAGQRGLWRCAGKYGKPPVPVDQALLWAKYAPSPQRSMITPSRKPVKKPIESKAARHTRAQAIVAKIDATEFVANQKMLMKAHKALASTSKSRSAMAFELAGNPDAFND